MAKATQAEKEAARSTLLKYLKPGSTVYGIVRKVSASGMSRTIDLYTVDPTDLRLVYLTGWASKLLEWSRSKDGALRVNGCGMDMVFHTVYSLGYLLWPQGTGEKKDGGYALRSEIL